MINRTGEYKQCERCGGKGYIRTVADFVAMTTQPCPMCQQKKENQMNLWLRVGDADDYNSFGENFDSAAQHLYDAGVRSTLESHNALGLHCHQFKGRNYISAYWGGKNAADNYVRGLNQEELNQINDEIKVLIGEE
jgi:RecJ-like exonuclease